MVYSLETSQNATQIHQEVLFLLGRSHLRCKEVPIDALIYEAVVSILGRRCTAHIDRDLGAEDAGLGKRTGCRSNVWKNTWIRCKHVESSWNMLTHVGTWWSQNSRLSCNANPGLTRNTPRSVRWYSFFSPCFWGYPQRKRPQMNSIHFGSNEGPEASRGLLIRGNTTVSNHCFFPNA